MINLLRSTYPTRSYNQDKIKTYLETYTLSKNANYPYFTENDCTNFISQTIYEGGVKQIWGSWDDFSSWFCNSTSSSDLYKISLTWRSARYFREHFKSRAISSQNKFIYKEVTVDSFLKNFDSYSRFLSIGSVIQYINLSKSSYPYHSQIIYNIDQHFKNSEIYVCQHSRDLFNYPLSVYLRDLSSKKNILLCLYIFKY